MPLLRNGQWAESNPWVKLTDNEDLPDTESSDVPVLCSMDRFLTLEADGSHHVSGVWLESDDDVTQLSDHLQRIQLIALDFPVYTDGRAYSQARLLRTQLGFSGEIRATGDIRTDQMLFMARAGIDTYDFNEQPDEQQVQQALTRFTANYQPSYSLPIAG